MSNERKPLSGILPGGDNNDDIFSRFARAKAAGDSGPLPKGVYETVAAGGKLQMPTGRKERYTIEFRVNDGKYKGRRLWLDRYFTEDAIEYTRRDLEKLGIDTPEKLNQPFPANKILCRLEVVVREGDDGIRRNEIRDFAVIGTLTPPPNPFPPPDPAAGPTVDPVPNTQETAEDPGNSAAPNAAGDADGGTP